MRDGKLTSRPPLADPGSVEEFLGGAGTQTSGDKVSTSAVKALQSELYPWEEPNVRKDVTKVFNLRLTVPPYYHSRRGTDMHRPS